MLTGAHVQDQKQNQNKINSRGQKTIMSTHALYRFFDAGGDLLYVGITNDPGRRWGRHANDKPWWHEVDRIELERYPSREDVLAAERKAIREEGPRYNLMHAVREAAPAVAEERPAPGKCACGAPATILFILYRDIAEYDQRRQEWHEKIAKKNEGRQLKVWDGEDMRTMPGLTPWQRSCDEHAPDGGNPYEIPYPTTWRQWADWTAHLLEKEWFPHTNWSQHLYAAGCAGA